MTAVDDTVAATAAPGPNRPELPPSLGDRVRSFGLRLGIELRPTRVIVAAVVVAVVAAGGWWLLRPPPTAAPEVELPQAGTQGGAATTSTPVDVASAETVVHAAGAVASPGLYRLGPGARVADVIDAAGGPTADADLDQLNLAAKVADGERVFVPREGQSVPAPIGPGPSTDSRLVDINRATADELDALPGIGPAIAQAIVDHRTRHGPFRTVDDLLEVRGIGEAKLAELRDRVTVG